MLSKTKVIATLLSSEQRAHATPIYAAENGADAGIHQSSLKRQSLRGERKSEALATHTARHREQCLLQCGRWLRRTIL